MPYKIMVLNTRVVTTSYNPKHSVILATFKRVPYELFTCRIAAVSNENTKLRVLGTSDIQVLHV